MNERCLTNQRIVAARDDMAASAPKAKSKDQLYADAARRMRRGQNLVFVGFALSIIGVVGYCLACLSGGVDAQIGTAIFKNIGWLVGPTLALIGLGTLFWLIGSLLYLSGAMEDDPERT